MAEVMTHNAFGMSVYIMSIQYKATILYFLFNGKSQVRMLCNLGLGLIPD